MADTVAVYLNGGPCDGQTKQLTQAEADSHETTCRGATYRLSGPDTRRFGKLTYDYVPARTGGGTGGGTGASAVAPHTYRAWHDLRKSVNKNMREALNHSDKQMTRALHSLGQARKVKL